MPQPPTPNQNIEQQLDRILGRHSIHFNYSKAETREKLLALVSEARIDELKKLKKHPRVYQDLGNNHIITYVHVKDIQDRLEELKQTPPTPNGDERGASEKPQPQEEARGKQVDKLILEARHDELIRVYNKRRDPDETLGDTILDRIDEIRAELTGLVTTPLLAKSGPLGKAPIHLPNYNINDPSTSVNREEE